MKQFIFRDLGTLLSAGMDAASAIEKLAAFDNQFDAKSDVWHKAAKQIRQGKTLSHALQDQGLISSDQASWLKASEQSGMVEQALKTIELAQTKRNSRIKKLKGKLIHPFFIIVVAVLCGAAVAIANEVSMIKILFGMSIKLGITILVFKWIFKQLEKDVFYWLSKLDRHQNSERYQIFFDQVCINSLYQLNQSGINYTDALKLTASFFTSNKIKNKLLKASQLCANGSSITVSINQAQLPATHACKQLLVSAEATGDWHGALGHYLKDNQKRIDDMLMGFINIIQKALFVVAAVIAFTFIF
ncbi:MAG: type II secretion system F family protein [Saccharospirillaceae bacterium]|nr:type II secretion system F family protein [Pseudomonadales bacterium]NRB78295.1 type II secretion system F family protein [Saccharospirillaceae bacterium]